MAKSASKGHAEHTKSADHRGLPGRMSRPIKITMLGAGSGFTPRLVNDVLRIPGEQGGTIALVDIDTQRLRTMHQLIEKLVAKLGVKNWSVVSHKDRTKVLKGSDYIVNCIEVSGVGCVRFDNDIPARYGIDQCIGDTIGPGGLFKSLRTIPVWLDVLRDAERLCPGAIVLNYTNPMSMMCLAAGRASSMQVVGLCHSVQGTSHLMAKRAGVPYEEMTWECAGINHLAWFTKLEHDGRDLYPRLIKSAKADLARAFKEGRPQKHEGDIWNETIPEWHKDLVRKDMMVHFGAFITESSGHLSEYLPYYRKRKDLIEKYARENYDGGTSFYADNWPQWRKNADAERHDMLAGKTPIEWERSWEYASWIIEAREKDQPFRIHGNVMNNVHGASSLITNLPADACVEVACMVDRNGIQPTRYGALPPQMAALCASNVSMFDLGAKAAIERSKEAAIYALMLDPLTAAVCSPAEIKAMTLEMFEAEKDFLIDYE
jgi:alpha-galactosidase